MFATVHIFKERGLLKRIRHTVDDRDSLESNMQDMIKEPLLQSIYMETLRVYVKSYFLTTSPLADINVGRWHVPKDKMILVNSGISHMDENFWNTKGGLWPVGTFWADRFITYPDQDDSGPMLREVANDMKTNTKISQTEHNLPYVSMEGLEGSWIPYGGKRIP